MNPTHFITRTAGVAAVLAALVSGANAQTLGCSPGGGSGLIPTSGTGGGGVYPGTFPPFETVLPLNVASVPPGSTAVTEVKLTNITHTFTGDLQFVLTAPSGSRHNIFVRGGGGCDLAGNYTFVAPCTGGAPMTSCAGVFAPGTYEQFFGTWTSGTNSVDNTPLSAIAPATGNWTLTIYDWAGGDVGGIVSWEICFGNSLPPTPPAGAPTLVSPADGAATGVPVTLTWNAVSCATTYDVELDGVVTTGLTGTTQVVSPAVGAHTWRVRAVNATATSAWSSSRTFVVAPPPPPSTCVTGGVGGTIPATGTGGGGIWPATLPPNELSSTAFVTPPAGSTQLVKVELLGFSHTWVGDLQVVLTDPTGARHNILHRPASLNGSVGLNCDLDGSNYVFFQAGQQDIPTVCPGTSFPGGDYNQYFGDWPAGSAGIFNTALSLIPVSAGNWTLSIYDWAGLDSGDLASWRLCFAGAGAPSVYCTAGTSSSGCVALISGTAQPSASLASACQINVADVEGQKQGLLFYGINNTGFTPLVWAPGSTSYLCVKAPTLRTGGQNSGGTLSQCDGSYTLDWNAFRAANPGALGEPFSVGDKAYFQAWYRDPAAPKTTNLSAGLEMTMVP